MKLNPLLSVWTKPKETVSQFIEHDKLGLSIFLTCIAGITGIITSMQNLGWFQEVSPFLLALGILMAGVVSGFINLGVNSLLYTGVGKLYGGHGKLRHMATAIGPMVTPQIFVLPVLIIYLIIFGNQFFAVPEAFSMTSLPLGAYLFLTLLTAITSIWSLVVSSKAIGIVHGFSSWRGFGVIMTIVGIVIVITVLIIIMVIMFMF